MTLDREASDEGDGGKGAVDGDVPGTSGDGDTTAPTTRGVLNAEALVLRAWPVALAFAIVGIPLRGVAPVAGLDGSWRLALSLAGKNHIPFGSRVIFTYGPLGFLSVPSSAWFVGLLFGLVFVFAAGFFLYYFSLRWLARAFSPRLALVALLVVVVASLEVKPVPEKALLAFTLGVLLLLDPNRSEEPQRRWYLVVGAVAALLVLVKGDIGLGAVAITVIFVAAARRRIVAALTTASAFGVAFVVLWGASRQRWDAIGAWARYSIEVARGYAVMVLPVRGRWLFLLAVVGVALVAGCIRLARGNGRAAWATILTVAFVAWLFAKEGFVRADGGHLATTFLGLGALLMTLPWTTSRRGWQLGVVGGITALLAITYAADSAAPDKVVRGIVDGRIAAAEIVARSTRAVVQPGYRADWNLQTKAALRRASVRTFGVVVKYTLPDDVLASLRGKRVQVDPWDVGVLWANDLAWRPVPAFQDYLAYTPALDDLDVRALAGSGAPDAILRSNTPSIDKRNVVWDASAYNAAVVCRYRVAVATTTWQSFLRAPNVCGERRLLAETTVAANDTVTVPPPSDANSMIVARFDVPQDVVGQLTGIALRPTDGMSVVIDGRRYRFVRATAGQDHLVGVPASVAGRRLPFGGLAYHSIRFGGSTGKVTVRFYEIALG
jgi:hypothetical protein